MADCYYHGQSSPGPCPECIPKQDSRRNPDSPFYYHPRRLTLDKVQADKNHFDRWQRKYAEEG